ncbi:hypothetical protein DSCO28_14290 [Desulfosarcina ovata subsp. sediminis]|uniref:Ribbon-helix-helix protein CopG domain-containing protein n=1 Tax=Desulfosarcina ovata subsp. sediminis TaxID=885957 RepID=A0A5K7ZR97_9BACT|nr:ribbon-helix-helix domain-containing protein [Desulfosarcina ovata]BBO80863.1 hypothetical protein DSCO28_14290 [Desulfosarcina ovata subsp. sediminis]
MDTVPVSGRIDKSISEKLNLLARATARSRSFLINEAIKTYVDEQSWQVEAINEGIKQADQGRFASQAKIRKTFAKYGVNVDED